MIKLPYEIYAEDINHNTYVETQNGVSGVYLHKALEHENGFDLVATENAPCDLGLEDGIYLVTVVFVDRTEENCKMYYWHADGLQKGLICRISDDLGNEDARKKFDARDEVI